MGIDAFFTHKGRILRKVLDGSVNFGIQDFSTVIGSTFDCHLEEVSDDERHEMFGDVSREIGRVYMYSLPDGIDQRHQLQLQPLQATDTYTWGSRYTHDIVSIEDAAGISEHLQMFVKQIHSH